MPVSTPATPRPGRDRAVKFEARHRGVGVRHRLEKQAFSSRNPHQTADLSEARRGSTSPACACRRRPPLWVPGSIGSPTPIADAQAGDRGRSPKGRVGRRGRTTFPRGKPTFLAAAAQRARGRKKSAQRLATVTTLHALEERDDELPPLPPEVEGQLERIIQTAAREQRKKRKDGRDE